MFKMPFSITSALAGATVASVLMTASAHAAVDVSNFRLSRIQIADFNGSAIGYRAIVGLQRAPGTNVTAIRPNGESNWGTSNPFAGVTQSSGAAYLSASSMEAWWSSNFTGLWQYGKDGVTDHAYDTTSAVSVWASDTGLFQPRFVSLTASSAAQFDLIRSQGLTGTFTFNLGSSVQQFNDAVSIGGLSNQRFSAYSAFINNGNGQPPYEILDVNGSSFSVTITSALSSTATLKVSQVVTFQYLGQSTAGEDINRRVAFVNDTYYGIAPVPAPGAAALLGVAGLAGRRRRK